MNELLIGDCPLRRLGSWIVAPGSSTIRSPGVVPADVPVHARRPARRARPRAAPGRRGAARARCGCSPAPAPARPGRSPTGSPTASPPGVYAPTEVLAVTFTTRAAGEMRGRLRALGAGGRPGPHLPLRGAAPAALLLAARPRHRAADADRVQDRPARRRRPPQPAQRRPGAAARPRLRDRVGQGQQRPPRRLRRGRAAPRAARSPATTPTTVGRVFAAYEEVKREPGPDGHGGRAAPHRRPARRGRAGRRPGPPPVQVVRRRRVPGRLARSSRRCSTCGSAAATSCAWSATRPRRSTPSPAPTPRYLRDFPQQVPRHHLDRAGPQLPLHPAGRRRRQHPARRRRRAAGVELRAQRPAGPAVDATPRTPTRSPRPTAVADRDRAARATRARRSARSRCCSASTPSPRPSRRRWPSAASPTSSAARPASSTGPRCARRSPGCAAPPAPARPADDAGRGRRAAILAGMGWTAEPPDRRAARPATAGSRWQALVDQADEFAARPARRRPRRLRRRARPARRRAARPGRRRRHPRDPPRRQGPGVGLGLPRRPPGRHPADHLRRHPGRGRGGAPAALRRHDPRPRRPARCRGRWPATPAAAARASRRASSTRCCPTTGRGRRASSRAAARSPAAASAASRWRTGAEKKRRPLRRLPGVVRRGALRAAARVAHGAGRRGRACRRSWSSPTPPCS